MKTVIVSLSTVAFAALVGCSAGPSTDKELGVTEAAATTSSAQPAGQSTATVEFRIPRGTGANSWNTEETKVEVRMGDVLRIINDDDVPHRLHTDDDRPCTHGTRMTANGGRYDCVVRAPYDSVAAGPLHDHENWDARFWVVVKP